jgi:hypothetical protein
MDQQHFAETGKASFFGDYVYGQIVAKDHFLRKLLQVIDCKRFSHKLIRLYKGEEKPGSWLRCGWLPPVWTGCC